MHLSNTSSRIENNSIVPQLHRLIYFFLCFLHATNIIPLSSCILCYCLFEQKPIHHLPVKLYRIVTQKPSYFSATFRKARPLWSYDMGIKRGPFDAYMSRLQISAYFNAKLDSWRCLLIHIYKLSEVSQRVVVFS